MNKKQSKHGLARVWPALGAMAIVAAGLTGGAGAWAADAPAAPAKPPETPAVAADETVVLDDALMWRIYRVEGLQHIRAKDGKLLAGQVSGWVGSGGCIDNEGGQPAGTPSRRTRLLAALPPPVSAGRHPSRRRPTGRG